VGASLERDVRQPLVARRSAVDVPRFARRPGGVEGVQLTSRMAAGNRRGRWRIQKKRNRKDVGKAIRKFYATPRGAQEVKAVFGRVSSKQTGLDSARRAITNVAAVYVIYTSCACMVHGDRCYSCDSFRFDGILAFRASSSRCCFL